MSSPRAVIHSYNHQRSRISFCGFCLKFVPTYSWSHGHTSTRVSGGGGWGSDSFRGAWDSQLCSFPMTTILFSAPVSPGWASTFWFWSGGIWEVEDLGSGGSISVPLPPDEMEMTLICFGNPVDVEVVDIFTIWISAEECVRSGSNFTSKGSDGWFSKPTVVTRVVGCGSTGAGCSPPVLTFDTPTPCVFPLTPWLEIEAMDMGTEEGEMTWAETRWGAWTVKGAVECAKGDGAAGEDEPNGSVLSVLATSVGVLPVSLETMEAAFVMAAACMDRGGVEDSSFVICGDDAWRTSFSGSFSILSQGQTSSKLPWLLERHKTINNCIIFDKIITVSIPHHHAPRSSGRSDLKNSKDGNWRQKQKIFIVACKSPVTSLKAYNLQNRKVYLTSHSQSHSQQCTEAKGHWAHPRKAAQRVGTK